MKNLLVLWVALAAMCFTGCSKDDDDNDNGEGVITMVTEKKKVDFWIFSFKEGETITIDWGDGQTEEVTTIEEYDDDEVYYYWEGDHSYANDKPHTITIKGNIEALHCGYNNLTTLDVSKCTALTELDCSVNDLPTLDVSKNTALTWLDCSYNNLSASALNRIFNNLPQGKSGIDEDGDYWESTIYIGDNPGSETCNRSIAENKGWEICNY